MAAIRAIAVTDVRPRIGTVMRPVADDRSADGRAQRSATSGDRFAPDATCARSEGSTPVPNPMLNDKQLEEARAGWAAPDAAQPRRHRCGRPPRQPTAPPSTTARSARGAPA